MLDESSNVVARFPQCFGPDEDRSGIALSGCLLSAVVKAEVGF